MAIGYWPTYYWGGPTDAVVAIPNGVYAICNQALLDLGADKIISFADGSVASTLCSDKWEAVRDSVLRAHPWNCVIKRKKLTVSTKSVTAITRVGLTATATSAAHGYANGDHVNISGATQSEYNGVYEISNITADTFDYTVSGSPATPATGTITAFAAPAYEYTYRHSLPTDLLRLLDIESDYGHKVENGYILSDSSSINIKYVYKEADPARYDKLLSNALVAAMSAELAYPIVRSHAAVEEKWKLYIEKLRLARSVDAQEDTPDTIGDFPLINNR